MTVVGETHVAWLGGPDARALILEVGGDTKVRVAEASSPRVFAACFVSADLVDVLNLISL